MFSSRQGAVADVGAVVGVAEAYLRQPAIELAARLVKRLTQALTLQWYLLFTMEA